MARSRNPEETRNLILDVALKLFLEKGYEETSIRDIIDGLGGLSKGAIYHHFKSKEEILTSVTEKVGMDSIRLFVRIRDDNTLSGIEKLKKVFQESLTSTNQEIMLKMAPDIVKNPKFLAIQIKETVDIVVPQYIRPMIEQCICEGSINTAYPKELAEVIVLLANLWLNPLVFTGKVIDLINRMRFFNELLSNMNIDLLDESMIELFIQCCDIYGNLLKE